MKKITEKEISLFCQQISILTLAGSSLKKAIELLKNSTTNRDLQHLSDAILDSSIALNCKKKDLQFFEGAFVSIFRRLLDTEDRTFVKNVILQIKEDMNRREKVKDKTFRILIYPISVLTIVLGLVSILLTFVIPQFSYIYAEFGQNLPMPTMILLNLSNLFQQFSLVIIALLFFVWLVLIYFMRDFLVAAIPYVRSIMREFSYSQFFSCFSTYIQLGDSTDNAFESAAKLVSNRFISWKLQRPTGTSFYQHIGKAFSDPVIGAIVESGENTSTLPETLLALAEHYECRGDEVSTAFIEVIEPLMILFIGLVVGFILVALYIPMFELSGFIR